MKTLKNLIVFIAVLIGSVACNCQTVPSIGQVIPPRTTEVENNEGKIIIAVHPASPGNIYKSTNSGSTFTSVYSMNDALRVSASSTMQYISVAQALSGNIVVSSDYGATWNARGASNAYYATAMSDDGKYQLATAQAYMSVRNFYISSDYGATWTTKTPQRYYAGAAVSSNGSIQVMSIGSNGPGYMYKSTDYGANWSQIGTSADRYCIAMSSDGTYILTGTYNGGIFLSSNSGSNFSQVGSTTGKWRDCAVSSTGQYMCIADMTTTTGGLYVSSNYGGSFSKVVSTTSGVAGIYSCAVSKTGRYMACGIPGVKLLYSSDYGANWSQIATGLNSINWYGLAISDQ